MIISLLQDLVCPGNGRSETRTVRVSNEVVSHTPRGIRITIFDMLDHKQITRLRNIFRTKICTWTQKYTAAHKSNGAHSGIVPATFEKYCQATFVLSNKLFEPNCLSQIRSETPILCPTPAWLQFEWCIPKSRSETRTVRVSFQYKLNPVMKKWPFPVQIKPCSKEMIISSTNWIL